MNAAIRDSALATGAVVLVRWIDRRVVAWNRQPDPLDALKRRHVRAEIDEREFQRRVQRLLDAEAVDRRGRPAGDGSTEVDAVDRAAFSGRARVDGGD